MAFHVLFSRVFCSEPLSKTLLSKRLGVSQTYVSLLCSGKSLPSVSLLSQCCAQFGIQEAVALSLMRALIDARGGAVPIAIDGLPDDTIALLARLALSSYPRLLSTVREIQPSEGKPQWATLGLS